MVNLVNSPALSLKTALILGGALSHQRREDSTSLRKPRVDVMEMESRFDARLFDYVWLEQAAENEIITKVLVSIARKFGHWSEMLSLRVAWDLRGYDAVYATGEDVGLPLAALLRIFHFHRPFVLVRTEQPVFGRTEFRQNLYKKAMQFAIRRIDVILTRTLAHADYINANFHLGKTRVFFSPETTDTEFYNLTTQALCLDSLKTLSKPFIVSAGLEQRDYETLIAAVEGLPVDVLICAGSPWAKVRFNPSGGDLPANVRVDSFSQLEMREIYRAAEFAVLPVFPTMRACGMNVILEAWAMGKAVIASRTEGLKSYLREGIDGMFVAPQDVTELRAMILYLLNSPEDAKRLGENGYQRVTHELSMEHYLEKVRETFSKVSRLEA
jgi:glycosyltransferase involved in cell wall biosynthesis